MNSTFVCEGAFAALKYYAKDVLIQIQDTPTLFELAEIDDDGGVSEGAGGAGGSSGRAAVASGQPKVSATPATATLNTPLVFADQPPLFSKK